MSAICLDISNRSSTLRANWRWGRYRLAQRLYPLALVIVTKEGMFRIAFKNIPVALSRFGTLPGHSVDFREIKRRGCKIRLNFQCLGKMGSGKVDVFLAKKYGLLF